MEDLEEDPSYRWWVGGPNQLGLFLTGKLPQLLRNVDRSQGWEVKAAAAEEGLPSHCSAPIYRT